MIADGKPTAHQAHIHNCNCFSSAARVDGPGLLSEGEEVLKRVTDIGVKDQRLVTGGCAALQ